MGAPNKGMEATEQPAAETLLTALKTINATERRKHASVLNYWLSIRGGKEFPPLHDFDPLEISDFGQSSMLAELIGGGHDAEIRHLGEALKEEGSFERIIDAPNPSILSSIARKLPIVTISRNFLAFEDSFPTANGVTHCWVTLLPLSSSGAWVDYVYAFVSVEATGKAAEANEGSPPVVAEDVESAVEIIPIDSEQPDETPEADEPVVSVQPIDDQLAAAPAEDVKAPSTPGFAKLFEGFAGLAGFYGQTAKADPVVQIDARAIEPPAIIPAVVEPAPDEPAAAEPAAIEPEASEPEAVESEAVEPEVAEPAIEPPAIEPPAIEPPADEMAEPPAPTLEEPLQGKLADVRAKADEARAAKLRANAALYEGLGAAYDFALDAEGSPEEYLRLVEAQGLRIQLRDPMAPVVRLAFDGLCDDSVIAQLEAVLAWALKQELPRGSLAARIDEAGGIAGVLTGESRAA